ncbi:MAG: DUF6398 domain-containing protein [Bacteroidales bacterium]
MEKEAERKKKIEDTKKALETFCLKHLDKEFLEIAYKLQKRIYTEKDPLEVNGKANNIAAAIIHIISITNLLFDEDMTPHVTVRLIAEELHAPPGPTASRSRTLRKKYGIKYYDPNYCTKAVLAMKPKPGEGIISSKPSRKPIYDDYKWLPGNTYEIKMLSKRNATTKAITAVRLEIRKLSMVPYEGEPEADLLYYDLEESVFTFRILLGNSDLEYFKRFLQVHLPHMKLLSFEQIF